MKILLKLNNYMSTKLTINSKQKKLNDLLKEYQTIIEQ